MSSSCPPNGISVAFHGEQAPFYYKDSSGGWKGLSVDYWNDVARLAGCNGVIMKDYGLLGKDASTQIEMLNGDIISGETFSTTLPAYFIRKDVRTYSYTQPAANYKLLFVEKSALGNSAQVASISFFIVFPLDVLLLFYASCKIIDFLEWCFKKCRSRKASPNSLKAEAFLDASDLIRYALFSFSIVFLVQQWSGYFNGNNLLSINVDGTPFFTMIAQFYEKKRQLVLDSFVPVFTEDEITLFFGGNSSLIYGTSVRERFELTCEQSSRVGVFHEYEYFEYLANTELNEECILTQIKLSEGQSSGVGWLNQAMHTGKPYVYLISKNGTRPIREIMDFALLSVYSYENYNNFLLRKSMPFDMFLTIEKRKINSDLQFSHFAMSLTQLQFPLIFLILGLIISLAGFTLEWIYYACRKHCSCWQRCKCCK